MTYSDDYGRGYADALTGAGWLASVDPTALISNNVRADWEPLGIREARRKYEERIAAKAWAEGYGTGIHDERMAADYNAGTSEGVTASRINPYETKEGAS